MHLPSTLTAALSLALVLPLAACGSSGDAAGGTAGDGEVAVTAAFYPLQFLAEKVGGEHVRVTSLAAPGAEAHDLELTPKQIGGLAQADAVVYLKGFQPAVDEALTSQAPKTVLDVRGSARLVEHTEQTRAGHEGESAEEHAAHAEEGGGHDHSHEGPDPHFWLDPTRMADAGDALAATLAEADPQHAADYEKNARALRAELERLDTELTDGLRTCESRTIVTGHEAFGYLADRYDLEQAGIAGLNGGEVSPTRLGEMASFVKDHDVTTVYSEVLLDPKIAQTVADETGAQVKRLDPVEAVSADSDGTNYLEIMRSNLTSLRAGQGCA